MTPRKRLRKPTKERGIIQFTVTFKPSFVESRGGITRLRESLYELAERVPEKEKKN